MAWLERHPTSGHFHLRFRWNGRRKRRSLSTDDAKAAEAIRLRFEENIALPERGRLELPPAADIMTFLLSDGKLATSPRAAVVAEHKTLRVVGDLYLAALGNGSVGANALENFALHLNHFCREFGDGFALQSLTTGHLQGYLNKGPAEGHVVGATRHGDVTEGSAHAPGLLQLGRADGPAHRPVPEPRPPLPEWR